MGVAGKEQSFRLPSAHFHSVSVEGRGPILASSWGEVGAPLQCRVGGGAEWGVGGGSVAAQNPPSVSVVVAWGPLLAPCHPGHVTSSWSCLHHGRRTQFSPSSTAVGVAHDPPVPAESSVCPRLSSLLKPGRVCFMMVPVQTPQSREPHTLPGTLAPSSLQGAVAAARRGPFPSPNTLHQQQCLTHLSQ